ncbi:MAG: dTDP-4-dehydrorhamnose 3,5-epimerase [Saprospiraceae bacterium]|nr:dTDP-4-dehydrorhamnose 3,5-epimerase [Saprospiraceae bacterium]MBP7699041.1 dTDP-4-dehydrorhamnose 3,5-epimerase [Saprospiraceae bacterium]
MTFTATTLSGSFVVSLTPFQDERGWFARTYCEKEFDQIQHTKHWVQLNHSFTAKKGTIRGMHYQLPPFAEIKLVRCIAGAVWDVIVDIREASPTFLQWFGIELSAQNRKMLYIPEGFAHGFQTLTDNAELIYHHSEFFTPKTEGGLRFDDTTLAIQWQLPATEISDRDRNHQLIDDNFKGFKIK